MKKLLTFVLATILVITNTQVLNAATDVKNDAGLSTSLVSYWEMEESSGTRVDSHGANDLTDNNTVGVGTGIRGNGADFVAANSERLTKTLGSTGLELTTTFSVSTWVKTDLTGAYRAIYYSGENTNAWSLFITNTTKVSFTENNIADNVGATTLSAGTWYHVVVVKDGDGANNLKLYINGTLDGTFSVGTVQAPSGTAVIGAKLESGSYANFWDGIIDETLVTGKAYTSSEVLELYNSGAGIPYDAGGAAPRRIINIQ